MAKSFDDLVAKTTNKRTRDRAAELTRHYLGQMLLAEIRRLQGMSQKQLADVLGVRQPSLSKLENQQDMHVSTLRDLVRALGGELVIRARFEDGEAELSQFAGPVRRSRRRARRPQRVREVKLVG